MGAGEDVVERFNFKLPKLPFQNLNKKPTVIQAKIWVIKSKNPIVEFANILIPTVPNINKGPRIISKAK